MRKTLGTWRKEELVVVCVPEAGMLQVGNAMGSAHRGRVPLPGEMVISAVLLLLCWS